MRGSASRIEGELHPCKNRSSDGLPLGTLCPLSYLWMTAPKSYTLFSGVATPETAMGIAV